MNTRQHQNTMLVRYMQIIDAVCRRDAGYFEEHPDVSRYRRAYIPGEMWPLELPQESMVEVVQLRPGCRTRRPYLPATRTGRAW